MPSCKWHTFWMASCLICYFIVILFYIERTWLPMRNLAIILPLKSELSGKFQRFNAIDESINLLKNSWISKNFDYCKMKNFKTFFENQSASLLKEIIQPPPLAVPPDKILLCLWNKNFHREIYRNTQKFAFKVLQESSSLASGNRAVQIVFLTPNRNMFAGKSVIEKGFWLCFGSILLSMSKEFRFVKWVRFFEKSCIVKWEIFFASFYWLWDFLLENL